MKKKTDIIEIEGVKYKLSLRTAKGKYMDMAGKARVVSMIQDAKDRFDENKSLSASVALLYEKLEQEKLTVTALEQENTGLEISNSRLKTEVVDLTERLAMATTEKEGMMNIASTAESRFVQPVVYLLILATALGLLIGVNV